MASVSGRAGELAGKAEAWKMPKGLNPFGRGDSPRHASPCGSDKAIMWI